MKKPFRVLSTTAMAAALSVSAIVPVMAAEAQDNSVKAFEIGKVVLKINDQLVAVDYKEYMLNLPFLSEEAQSGVKYVQFGSGERVLAIDYLLELGAQSNSDEDTYNELVKDEKLVDVEVVEGNIAEDGSIVTDEQPEDRLNETLIYNFAA